MSSTILPNILSALASREHYAARKKNPDRDQPSLFETSHKPYLNKLGPGRWITIHAGDGEGEGKGGHHVFVGDDGKMKTGKFAGKTMSEAFGDRQPKPKEKRLAKRGGKHERGQPGLFETEAQESLPGMGPGNFLSQDELREYGRKALENDRKAKIEAKNPAAAPDAPAASESPKAPESPDAKPGDQLGLFGCVANVPRTGPATLKPGGETAGKQSALFDTKGDKDQMMMFDDGVTPRELVLKPEEGKKPAAPERRDNAVVNIPLSKRGDIDKQLDAHKAKMANEAKNKRSEDHKKFTSDKQKARDLFAKYADSLAESTAAKHGKKASEVKKHLESMVKWEPSKAIEILESYTKEATSGTKGKAEKYSAASDAQREAGNYKMDHIRLHGLDISIETPKGQRRRPGWPPMPADYGYVRGTRGKDGDHVDIFVGPDRESELVVVVDQINQDGIFDEHKCLIGYRSESAAVEAYEKAYTPGWKVGPVTCMTIGQFKAWLQDGDQNKRIAGQVSKYSSRVDNSPLLLLSDLVPIELVRYDWNAAAHPRHAAGSAGGIGGEFAPLNRSSAGQRIRSGSPAAAGQPRKPAAGPRTSRKRELAEHPPTIRPGHALHLSALDGGMRAKLLDWAGRMHELTMPMYPMPTSPLSKEEQAEEGWGRVNKNAARSLLDEMNQMDREARANGLQLSDFVNANKLIPRQIAERLDGGSRFFDPEKIREKLHISNRNPNYVEPPSENPPEKSKKSEPPAAEPSKSEEKPAGFEPSSVLTPHENRSLDAAVREAVGENPSAEKHFKTLALEAWQQMKQSADEHNYAFDQILGFADKTHTTRTVGQGEGQQSIRVKKSQSRLLNQIRSGADPSTIKNFDEIVDFAKREFPGAISFVGGDSDTGSAEDGLLNLLREGRQEVPKPHSPEVLDRAREMAGPHFWDAVTNPDFQDDQEVAAAVGSEHEEEIPFSVRRSVEAALIRYWGRPACKKSA